MIELKDVCKFNLKNINFKIEKNDWFAILGHNGAGKTTILKLIYGVVKPDKGNINLFENKIKPVLIKRKIAFITQDGGVLDNKDVVSNLSIPLKLNRRYTKTKVSTLINKLGLSEFAKLKACELPASRRQLLKIGIAVSKEPLVLLADEPMEHLDNEKSELVLSLFNELHLIGTTIVFTTSKSVPEYFTKGISLKNGEIIEELINKKEVSEIEDWKVED
jgi:ABC-type multidrug transport system ATPase subunit